jgi:hypothetical protein
MPNRRSFLEASLSAILAGIAGLGSAVGTPVPANTTDVHHHIYDSRFPPDPSATLTVTGSWLTDADLAPQRHCNSNIEVISYQ